MVEINKNQYTCHSGYVGLSELRSPVAPIDARILSSNAGERGPRANAECGNYGHHYLSKTLLSPLEGSGSFSGFISFYLRKKNRIPISVEIIWVTVIQILSGKRVQVSDEYIS